MWEDTGPVSLQTLLSAWPSLLLLCSARLYFLPGPISLHTCLSGSVFMQTILSAQSNLLQTMSAWWYPDLGCPASQCLPVVLLLSGEQEMLPGPGPALYSRHSQWHSQSVSGRVAGSTLTCSTQHSTLGDHVITNTPHHNQHKTHIWRSWPGERSVRGWAVSRAWLTGQVVSKHPTVGKCFVFQLLPSSPRWE